MLVEARAALKREANAEKAAGDRRLFKNSDNDVFLGVPVPVIRRIGKRFEALPLRELELLMKSRIHEERTLAHAILRGKFAKGNEREQKIIFKYYLGNRSAIRNWDGVDDSAPYIAGAYLLHRDKKLLMQLACSRRLWDRRIAIVATLWFIRNGQTAPTFRIARMLLNDQGDLIHKATGWMLREAGKRDLPALKRFLRAHHRSMPRSATHRALSRKRTQSLFDDVALGVGLILGRRHRLQGCRHPRRVPQQKYPVCDRLGFRFRDSSGLKRRSLAE